MSLSNGGDMPKKPTAEQQMFKAKGGSYLWLKKIPNSTKYQTNQGSLTPAQIKEQFGAVLIPRRRFVKTRENPATYIWLEFDPATGQAFFVGQWYSLNILGMVLGIKESPESQQLGAAISKARMATDRPATFNATKR